MAENLMDTTMTTMGFVILGFGLMFGSGNNFFGQEWFFLCGLPDLFPGLTIPTLAFFFQFAFCAAASTIAAMFLAYINTKKWDVSMAFNGALGGLVAITAPTAFVTPQDALVIGMIAGIISYYGVGLMETRLL